MSPFCPLIRLRWDEAIGQRRRGVASTFGPRNDAGNDSNPEEVAEGSAPDETVRALGIGTIRPRVEATVVRRHGSNE